MYNSSTRRITTTTEAAGRKAAGEAYTDLRLIIRELLAKGATQTEIAAELNRLGHTTRRGRPWNQPQVGRVLQRVAGEA